LKNTEISAAAEAILFAAGAPVAVDKIAAALEISTAEASGILAGLMCEYDERAGGLAILKLQDSYQMCTKKEYGEYVRRVMDLRRNTPLSQAALEVLAVIAYNQPVTKAFVEQVRGVDCAGVVGSLTTKGLIEERGRLELPGRPLLYGTTELFLRCFQLGGIEELPSLETREGSPGDLPQPEQLQLRLSESEE